MRGEGACEPVAAVRASSLRLRTEAAAGMKKRLSILLLGALAASPAAAADWPSVAGWDIHEIGRDRCVVGRSFEGTGTTFGIIMSVAGDVRLFATGAGWPTRNGQPSAGAVLLDGASAFVGRPVGMEQQQNRGFVAAASPDFLPRFARASQLGLHAGPGTDQSQLPLTGAGLALAQAQRCLANLREEARAQPVASSPPVAAQRVAALSNRLESAIAGTASATSTALRAARGPTPRGSKNAWMANAEYPSAAMQAGEQGAVTVKLAIDTTGGVAACDIVRSSGSRSLDAETCRTVKRRARYSPATDERGQPVASVDQHTVRWALPE